MAQLITSEYIFYIIMATIQANLKYVYERYSMKQLFILFFILLSSLNADWMGDLKEKTSTAYNQTLLAFADENLTISDMRKKHFNKVWADLFDDFEDAAKLEEELVSAPDKAWFNTDKEDLRHDIDAKVNNIIEYLADDDLLSYKEEISSLKVDITEQKEDIVSYREKKVGAPVTSIVHTTKDGYDEKIQRARDSIVIYQNDIRIIQNTLALNLNNIGVDLNEKQIDILLTRIDGDNFVQMSLAMDILSQITDQLMKLMKDSNEELEQAKKYYAMHLVSLELLVEIQQKYIDKLDNEYIPRIDSIIKQAQEMITQTGISLNKDKSVKRKSIYKKNIENQKLTFKVAKLYRDQMYSQKRKVHQAQVMARNNLKLSRNTYRTVLLSADLYGIMAEDQEMFNKAMEIQIPEIVPFENIQIQNKYKELTNLLKKD